MLVEEDATVTGVIVLLCTALDLAGVTADTPSDGYLRKERLAEVADAARELLV